MVTNLGETFRYSFKREYLVSNSLEYVRGYQVKYICRFNNLMMQATSLEIVKLINGKYVRTGLIYGGVDSMLMTTRERLLFEMGIEYAVYD